MRTSNRSKILDAAIRVIERDGVTGVTFDAVAAEAGVTRGGMMYHFPSREALIAAIHGHLAQQWEASLVESAGKSAAQASASERYVAYARTCAQSATRAELLFMLDAPHAAQAASAWDEVLAQWAAPAPAPAAGDDPAALAQFIARLAADGMWVYEALSNAPLPADLRQRVAEQLTRMIQGSSTDPGKRPARN